MTNYDFHIQKNVVAFVNEFEWLEENKENGKICANKMDRENYDYKNIYSTI